MVICNGMSDNRSTSESILKLHWLRFKQSCMFQFLTIVHRVIFDDASPAYLKRLVSVGESYSFRRQGIRLNPSRSRVSRLSVGGWAFSYFAPMLWNQLLVDLTSQPCLFVDC